MSTRRTFAWGRWIRVSVAHHYLQVDKAWFARNVRPLLRVLQISEQARACRRKDLDARAARIACGVLSLHQIDVARDCVGGDVRSYALIECESLGLAGTDRGEDAVVGVAFYGDHRDFPSSNGSYFLQRLNANASDRDFRAGTGCGCSK